MTTGAGWVGAMLGDSLPHGEILTSTGIVFQRWYERWRRWWGRAENIIQNPLAANHWRGSRGIRRDGENAALAEQSASLAILVERDAAEAAAVHVRNSIVLCKPFVQEGVVRPEKVEHTTIFAHDALEEKLGFLTEGLSQIV